MERRGKYEVKEDRRRGLEGLDEARCPECHKLLYRGKLERGSVVEVVCPRCKALVVKT